MRYKTYKLPVKSVGCKGDDRSYGSPLVIEILDKTMTEKEIYDLRDKLLQENQNCNRVLLKLNNNKT